jgi:protein involved in polysaccharide export with SLBB domain
MLNHIKLSSILLFALIIMPHVFLSQIPLIAQAENATAQGPESSAEATGAEVVEVEPKAEEEVELEKGKGEVIEVELPDFLGRFGYDFFTGARNRIIRQEQMLTAATEAARATPSAEAPTVVVPTELARPPARDAISGFVGPVDMMDANVAATVPAKYVLAPGDRLTVRFWSDVLELQTLEIVVDEKGEVIVPRLGSMVVRSMTLAQFQDAVKEELERVAYKNLKLIATLDSLRSIQVFITGEAFRPGSYAVSSVTTMFNALYMCGGPSENGSLRNIKLLRNTETKTVDYYRFLMDGDSSQDYSLNAGDTIFITQVGKTASISGEVKRPAIYELKEGENLLELISLAGGIRPSGYLQRVQIDSVEPGVERIVLDVDVSDTAQADAPVFDGDTAMVFSIPSEHMNTVNIEGEVRMPGTYQLKEGMAVSDLMRAAQGLLGEAYTERADLLRLNDDNKTTRLIPINLSKAFAGDLVHNMALHQWDRLVVYSKWDVKWTAERVVSVYGAVQSPGSYEKPDGMTIQDLLMRAGGVLPDAYLDRALLMRLDERGEMTKSIPVSLKGAETDLELDDSDFLMVYTRQEARWEPEREVTVEGAVQNPNAFARTDGMTVSDLIHRAGGLLPDAYPDRALLLRLDSRQRVTQGFSISPKLALQDDPRSNLELRDGDKLVVYTYQEAVWEPERKVTIVGAVHRPGDVPIDEIIEEPGDVPDVGRPRITEEPEETEEVKEPEEPPERAATERGPSVIALPEEVQPEAEISPFLIPPKGEEEAEEEEVGAQMASVFERVDGMRVSDLIHRAGGLLPNAYLERADLRRMLSDYETYVIIPVNLARILAGDKEADILLQDEDVFTVYTIREAQYKPENTVIMYGAVQRPDIYTRTAGMKLSDLLFTSGGLLPGALKDAEITRIDKEGKTVVRTVDVIALAAGDESQDIMLEDGDVVSIRKDNDFLDVLRTVTIEGEVRYPGSYALKHNERLSDLIIRAGGLTDRAFPEASVITRKQEYLALEEQKKSVKQVKELLETLSDQEYYREVAKARLAEERRRGYKMEQEPLVPYEMEQEIPASAIAGIGAAAAGAITSIPEQTELAVSDIEAITQPQYTLVTPARKIESFLPIGRVIVNLNEAINNPGKKDDIILEDGDKIVIPPKLDIVSISGAVIQPSSLVYVRTIKPKKVKDYIEMVGGYSRDADREAVYVVKANGMVIKGNKATIDAGDMIIVPTKIMTQKITDRWGQVISATKFVVTTLALVVTVKLVLDAIK